MAKKKLKRIAKPKPRNDYYGSTAPPGADAPNGWYLSPDQRDRNSAWSLREMRRRQPRGTWI